MSREESERLQAAVLAALRQDGATRERLVRALAQIIQDRRQETLLRRRRRSLDR